MLTLNTHARISSDTPILSIDLKGKVPDGEYDVVIVLNENEKHKTTRLNFPVIDIPVNPKDTFRREDMYGDEGR